METWKKIRLGSACRTNTDSYSPKEKWDFVNYLDTGNITNNTIDSIQFIDLTKEKLPSRARRKVRTDSIVYSTVRPNQHHFGIIKSQPENFLVSTGFTVIDVDTNVLNADFLYYLLTQNTLVEALHAIAEQSTSAYPSIKPSDIENLEIEIPDILTQKKIANILNSLDGKVTQNNEINKNLEQQAQTIFKSWFVDFEPFGGVQPSEMQFIPLQELCKVVTKGTTPTTLGKSFTNSGINFIKAESIHDNHSIDSSKFAFIDEETNALLKRSIIKANDIVFTIAGTLGRFAMIDNSMLPANTNQAVAIIRPDETKVTPAYLYSFFIGNWHNEYYSKRIQQAVQANLSLTTIKSLPIAVLNDTTMSNYDKLVSPLFALMKNNEEENRRLSKLRDALLPRLMSGELDVSNIEI